MTPQELVYAILGVVAGVSLLVTAGWITQEVKFKIDTKGHRRNFLDRNKPESAQ